MIIAPIDLLLRVSAKSIGACEVPANTNAGPYVERVLKRVGLKKGDPWCAAEVADTGYLAFGEHWPLPLTGGCQVLYEFAAGHGLIAKTPSRGDVFLIWHAELRRFAHTGLIVSVPTTGGPCTTHEGNTSGGGSREGWLKAERQRHFAPEDRFIQWTSLLPSDE
jgi:hypothetical protein